MFWTRKRFCESKNTIYLEAMYRVVDEVAKKAQLKKIAKNHYVFEGEDDLAYLGIFVFNIEFI